MVQINVFTPTCCRLINKDVSMVLCYVKNPCNLSLMFLLLYIDDMFIVRVSYTVIVSVHYFLLRIKHIMLGKSTFKSDLQDNGISFFL